MTASSSHTLYFSVVFGAGLLLLLCATSARSNESEAFLVQTLQGPIRGYRDPVEDIFTFHGIPYATIPTGPNRYKPPLPAPVWITPLEAVDDSIICPQNIELNGESFYTGKKITENCLIANVYRPNINQTNIPVVVYVHGGGFQIGFGDMYLPKKLSASQGIIVVTFNYRLGVHGFLCLGTKDVPGNAGMKDQLALLRWVKDNISSFGGNPNDVTIAGYSAGSASVTLLMLSPAARGLFTKVIPESAGIVVGPGVQIDPIENAKEFARRFISNVDNITALEEFYRETTFETITSDAFFDRRDSTFLFTPCIERESTEEPFLTQNPYIIAQSGQYEKVPLLYGFTDMEGLLRIEFFETWKGDMNTRFSDFLPADLRFESVEEKNRVAMEVKQFYFGYDDVSEENVLSYVDFFTDLLFVYPIMKSLEIFLNSGHENIFLYEYSFVDEDTPVVPYTNIRGADHCAQTIALFDLSPLLNMTEEDITEEYRIMKATLRELWGNFIKTGVPIPAGSQFSVWPPTGTNGSQHMSLNNTLELRGAVLEDRMRLWDRIYNVHYRQPMPPQPSSATTAKIILNVLFVVVLAHSGN